MRLVTKAQISKLCSLIERVRTLSTQRGKRAELARFLGKPPQRVNDWLSGEVAPGGEITLLMLEWVQAEEANQQKSLGGARNTTKAKTRKLKSLSHEKSKQVRKR
jgi:DNA-binding transcriptional regulator YiaG